MPKTKRKVTARQRKIGRCAKKVKRGNRMLSKKSAIRICASRIK